MWCIYSVGFYSAVKKKIMKFAGKGIELEENYAKWTNQLQRDNSAHSFSYVDQYF